jgi:pimeloyl-ACP methyl ester carboxylesterase
MLKASEICDAVGAAYDAPSSKQAIQIKDGIFATIAQYGDETLVCIPGTQNLAEWLVDFSAWPRMFPLIGLCHEGFGMRGLEMAQALKTKLPSTGRLVIGGHSLGGALAQVCAVALGTKARIMGFGSPRVAARWNMTFGPALKTNLSVDLFANYGDPVPDLPGKLLFGHKVKETFLGAAPLDCFPSTFYHKWKLYSVNLKSSEPAAAG